MNKENAKILLVIELNKFKNYQNQESNLQVSTARLARGHQKTKSDLSLAYFKNLETNIVP